MPDRFRFFFNRLKERLWVRPLAMCLLSIAGVFLATTPDLLELPWFVPDITRDSVEKLLTVISASMLVIATFAVASMVSAYASASSTATPRSFPLVVADDVSQNALSTFLGAFIFSIVALVALLNGFYDSAGRFALFLLTLVVFAVVILTFVRWVDRIARLGRLGGTIDKVEEATAAALRRRRRAPTLRGIRAGPRAHAGRAVSAPSIGYVQCIDVPALQKYAEDAHLRIVVAALPGAFCAPGRPLAYVTAESSGPAEIDGDRITQAFTVGDGRVFDDDPRFGLIVLSEIADRALSPAVNDPGTAIDIIGTLVRLFAIWVEPVADGEERAADCDRVEVPELSVRDMFDDAFTAIARDGAGAVEVALRLQKAFETLASMGDAEMREAAKHHARLARARCEKTMQLPDDLDAVRRQSRFADSISV